MVYKFFDKKTSACDIKNKNMLDKELAPKITQTNY